MNKYRTHNAGELRASNEGADVKLSGWLSAKRDHGGIFFIHVRDFHGLTQVVVQEPDVSKETIENVLHTHLESVVSVTGKVRLRPEDQENPNIKTGRIEVVASSLEVISRAETPPPFMIEKDLVDVKEEIRLKYRFLDLRRENMRNNIVRRAEFAKIVRETFSSRGFLEIHTPILSNSSPEGARDFLVPSRLNPGSFFALPQAPQQWKQLLVASGIDRYFQIAPCFRDEDARADRSPGEFYQIDLEMAFVEQEDVLSTIEEMMIEIGGKFSDKQIPAPFPRMTYADVIEKYGSDKPDIRFGFEMMTITEHFRESGVRYLKDTANRGDAIRGLIVPDSADKFTRKELDSLEKMAKGHGLAGMAWAIWTAEGVKGTLTGPMPPEELENLKNVIDAKEGTVLFVCAGPRQQIDTALSAVRHSLGDKFELRDPNILKFMWVVDFPMYEKDEETGEIVFSHNPFSMPQGGLEALNTKDPLEIMGYQYDLVCNGYELSSGAIRNNLPEVLYRAFEIAGYERATIDAQFGHMITAFKLGTPPHGGFAPGFERLLMIFLDETSIREVIPFPKNQRCQDLMVGAPSEVDFKLLRELYLQQNLPKDKQQ